MRLSEKMFDPAKVSNSTPEIDADVLDAMEKLPKPKQSAAQDTPKEDDFEFGAGLIDDDYILDDEDEADAANEFAELFKELYGTSSEEGDDSGVAYRMGHHVDLPSNMAKYFNPSETYAEDTLDKALTRVYLTNVRELAADSYIRKVCEQMMLYLRKQVQLGKITNNQAAEMYALYGKRHKLYHQVANLLVMGEPGGGKTSIIRQWAEEHNVKLVIKTAAEITQSVIRGIPYAADPRNQEKINAEFDDDNSESVQKMKDDPVQIYLRSTFFDDLILTDADRKRGYEYSVLFLDEINRSYAESEAGLLTLIQDHTINDRNAMNGRYEFSDMLFTVAACNPPNSSPEARKLGLAMNTRFGLFIWNSSVDEMRDFITRQLKIAKTAWKFGVKHPKRFEYAGKFYEDKNPQVMLSEVQSKQKLIDIICGSQVFEFSSPEECKRVGNVKDTVDPYNVHVINSRTFYTALLASNGTPGLDPQGDDATVHDDYAQGSFMYTFREYCTRNPQKLTEMSQILRQYEKDMRSTAQGVDNSLIVKFNAWKQTPLGRKACEIAGINV